MMELYCRLIQHWLTGEEMLPHGCCRLLLVVGVPYIMGEGQGERWSKSQTQVSPAFMTQAGATHPAACDGVF
jgi:hypothetical protein